MTVIRGFPLFSGMGDYDFGGSHHFFYRRGGVMNFSWPEGGHDFFLNHQGVTKIVTPMPINNWIPLKLGRGVH